jgi:aminopeptidase N
MVSIPTDPSSNANVKAFVTKHMILDLWANFEPQRGRVEIPARTLSGSVELHLERRDPAATELVLDTRDLMIASTSAAIGTGSWVETAFKLDAATPAFGSALRITMPPGTDRVKISYATSPDARGLQWLSPEQTAGRKHPFLFSQAQAIQARSFIPLQDWTWPVFD